MSIINIEIILKPHCDVGMCSKKKILELANSYLEHKQIRPNTILKSFNAIEEEILHENVQAIIIDDIPNYSEAFIDLNKFKIKWYTYTLDGFGPENTSVNEGDEDEVNIASNLMLPSAELYNIWHNLYYDHDIKNKLINYAQSLMEFSDRKVDPNVISCNRVILLHGPPGTGKTSLCKALAHKLSIRMNDRYSTAVLIEINTHSLFSKWFSESGKLINKMFDKVKELVLVPNNLVCVLIDEVESLAHARNKCISGNEPSDSLRAVNAVLTQLDKIKRYPNVLILATSNMTEAIDLAFIDRADIKLYIGLPSKAAIYKIYHSCLEELLKTKLIHSNQDIESIEMVLSEEVSNSVSKKLLDISIKSVGLSGRTLRKVPFIAHALYSKKTSFSIEEYFEAMDEAIKQQFNERKYFTEK